MAWVRKGNIKGPKGDDGKDGLEAPLSDALPKGIDGDGAAGVSQSVSRDDHVHPNHFPVPDGDHEAATKKYVDDLLKAFAGGISFLGTYDAANAVVERAIPNTLGVVSGQPLPDADAANRGCYLICTSPGEATTTDFVDDGPLNVGDWVISDGVPYDPSIPDNGWLRVPMGLLGAYLPGTAAITAASPVTVTNGGVLADGVEVGVTAATTTTSGVVTLSKTAASNLAATATAGTANGTVANADHVHKMPTAADVGAAAAAHTHTIANVTGLQTELDGHLKLSSDTQQNVASPVAITATRDDASSGTTFKYDTTLFITNQQAGSRYTWRNGTNTLYQAFAGTLPPTDPEFGAVLEAFIPRSQSGLTASAARVICSVSNGVLVASGTPTQGTKDGSITVNYEGVKIVNGNGSTRLSLAPTGALALPNMPTGTGSDFVRVNATTGVLHRSPSITRDELDEDVLAELDAAAKARSVQADLEGRIAELEARLEALEERLGNTP